MSQDKLEDARATFGRELAVARNTGESRQAYFWIAATYVREGDFDQAIAAIEKGQALSQAEGDPTTAAGDDLQIASILREAGRYDQSLARLNRAVETLNAATNVPAAFKATMARSVVFDQGRVAAARGDLDTANARLAAYTDQIAARNAPFEARQQHELAGMIALAAKDYATALTELAQANQRDPRVLFMMAQAHQGAGHADLAKQAAAQVADFNSLAFNLAYVQDKAESMAGR
jgi:tetratricopeptide (TPR) repeat protein